eukprot:gene14840-20894_t
MDEELAKLRQIAEEIAKSSRSSYDISKPTAEGLMQILKLKNAFKNLAKSADGLKEDTSQGKMQLEQAGLQLQNLLYEKQYYDKEIRGCMNTKSSVTDDQIALQTEEEFWETADEDLKEKAKTKGTDHELMLQRLAHETRSRKQMVKDLDSLKAKKNQLLKTVTDQQKNLKELQTSLKTVGESAKPLQSSLAGYPLLKSSRQADLLPLPLYVLFSQLSAGKDALGLSVNVSISGALDEAESLAKHELEADNEEQQASKKPKLEIDGDYYKEHPLKIDLELLPSPSASGAAPSPAAKPLMTIKFQYLMGLKVIAASCTNTADNQILAALFPADDGSTMPSESLLHLQSGTFKFDPKRAARPYRWCQHLGGLDFIPTLPLATQLNNHPDKGAVLESLEGYRRQQRVVTLVLRLQSLKEAAASLNTVLASLLKSPVPQDLSMYPRHPTCTIFAWEDITSKSSTSVSSASKTPIRSTKTPIRAPIQLKAGDSVTPVKADLPVDLKLPVGGEAVDAKNSNSMLNMLDSGLEEGETAQPEGSVAEEGSEEGEAEVGALVEAAIVMPETPIAGGPDLAAAYWAGHEDGIATYSEPAGGSAPPVAPKPAYRLYRCVLRSRVGHMELEAHVRLFVDYPLRPPLIRIAALKEMPTPPAKGHAKQLLPRVCKQSLWMESEANMTALSLVPAGKQKDTLLYQLTHLRLCFDEFSSQHVATAVAALGAKDLDLFEADVTSLVVSAAAVAALGAKDLDMWAVLKGRQRLRGRERRPPSVALPPSHEAV